MNPIQKAIDVVGGRKNLAQKLEVTPMAVYQWLKKRRAVSAERAIAIELATEGIVSRHELRPDLFGEPPSKAGGVP